MQQAKFHIGQIVDHRLFHYRGVIYEVDPVFSLTEEWYEQVARSKPPKDEPWYHVLVDNALHTTYVAERNLVPSVNLQKISHPDLDKHFTGFSEGCYQSKHIAM